MKRVTLYTDGACSGNPGVGGWGAVLIYKGHEKRISGAEPETTNNIMELTAVIMGLKCLKEECLVDIYSDSAYVVNAYNKGWLKQWEKSNWVKADNKPLANDELWQEFNAYAHVHHITMYKVKGHSDNEYNNICDKLATDAIKEYKTAL